MNENKTNINWYDGHITDDDRICDKMAQILNIPDYYELVFYLPDGVVLCEEGGLLICGT